MKKIIMIMLVVLICINILACGSEKPQEATDSISIQDITEAMAETPVLLTSAGQSADFDIAKTLMDKTGIDYEGNATITAGQLNNQATLMVAVGGSSKGLGAAGIDADDELKRVTEVIAKAKEDGMTIIALHIGGEGRRGTLSDRFINAVLPESDYIIAVATGDTDGLMSNIAVNNGIPMAKVDTIGEVIGILTKTFK
ncbi:DUF6305 family protein [Natronincola ferrireducens]|uniref:DUF6305 domain-containing protein n=1 Tax=Natronincola ferrireducens TaxID=393762 RepID=A0A1G9FRT4_9FIRM|nr:DUF6305 family protein [Natronincola ferrireducens]SDK91136.1 hypothetical protein SAMN05660472_02228 [Natronincola ferrireducens]